MKNSKPSARVTAQNDPEELPRRSLIDPSTDITSSLLTGYGSVEIHSEATASDSEATSRRHRWNDSHIWLVVLGFLVLSRFILAQYQSDHPIPLLGSREARANFTGVLLPEMTLTSDARIIRTPFEYIQETDLQFSGLWKSILVEAALAVALQCFGLPLFSATAFSHHGWVHSLRFVGRWVRRPASSKSWLWRTFARPNSKQQHAVVVALTKVWKQTKRGVKHVYTKRSRYSVASELTNLVPPSKDNNTNMATKEIHTND